MVHGANAIGPRVLLRRLREVMARRASSQEKLDLVVRIIAGNMVAEVCSVYLMRAGEVLELFATEGLNPQAVHQTRLRVGEGLIGDIAAHARALNLPDAQSHPFFAYRPETGEEIYHSLMGVPILRAGKVLGVLAVQNRTQRHYTDEEVEALQNVAMVLAELVGSGEFIGSDELHQVIGDVTLPQRLEGLALNEGLAQGEAVLHEPRIQVERVIAEDVGSERERLEKAVESLRQAVGRMLVSPDVEGSGEHREVLEAYQMLAHDRGWLVRMGEAVATGLTAEAAVLRIQVETRARMAEGENPYLRERLHDFEDLSNRLLRHLSGEPATAAKADLPEDAVVIARSMGPAELLDYDRSRLRAVVLEEGSPTAHVTIVARSLEIPVVGRVEGALKMIEPGDPVIVDGDNAQVFIRPADDVRRAFNQNMAARAERQAEYAALRDHPALSLDGVRVSLNINAGLLADLPQLDLSGAEGIGLYRTEIAFMVRSTLPTVREQTELYTKVVELAGERPVVFRTLDIGGDKLLPYQPRDEEENPAMGWRAIRIGLDRPALLRTQVRALLKAAAGRTLHVMFPMIAEVAEFDAARAIVDKEVARLGRMGGALPAALKVGAMLEVPALAWQLPALLGRVDFLSVGSNDLLQFLFASDRGNPRLAARYDILSPGVLALLRHLVRACDAAEVPLSVCGEMAGRPLEAMALIGLGLRSVSMTPSAIGPVKSMVRSLDVAIVSHYLESLYELPDHSVRSKLSDFARDHQIAL
jgi:phosphotransferase system enzyme I (PtsP)